MKLNISVKGKAFDLNASEVNNLLQGLEFAMGGGSGSKTFGCVTARCEGVGSLSRSQGAGGTERFTAEREDLNAGIAPEYLTDC